MEFRPCIDIHNGKVKQIVGGSLRDASDMAEENFVSVQDAAYYAAFYKKNKIRGGHIILLNPEGSGYYEATRAQALSALKAYPGGLQVGGGIRADNAVEYLDAGASHVIVTSYVFQGGKIRYDRLKELAARIGKDKLVLDLSCRKKGDAYYIVTDRWQNYTEVELKDSTLDGLASYCDEFLVHAVDVEGRAGGIECPVAAMLGAWGKMPVTYAGGVHDFHDLELLKTLGKGRVNVTIGSALDLFGGSMGFSDVLDFVAGVRRDR